MNVFEAKTGKNIILSRQKIMKNNKILAFYRRGFGIKKKSMCFFTRPLNVKTYKYNKR